MTPDAPDAAETPETPDAGRSVDGFLDAVAERSSREFRDSRRVQSLREYLEACAADPYPALRGTARWLADVVDHRGSRTVRTVGGEIQRWAVFDGPEDAHGPLDGTQGRVVGQERVQGEIVRLIRNAAAAGRAGKLILLHGPNGSSKTSLVDALFKSMSAYSRTDEGALHRFSWVFPRRGPDSAAVGFTAGPDEDLEDFAHLEHGDLAAVLPCELRDHPLLVLPPDERRRLVESWVEASDDPRLDGLVLDPLLDADLCPKCRRVADALLTGARGDWLRVAAHVRVERFYLSRRYREGEVTIEPQMHVDAGVRMIAAENPVAGLPPALQSLRLPELHGDLVDANRGLLEYSDFLKRPTEANKYLLTTTEKGTINLPGAVGHLDLVMIGTSNAKHLDAFKEDPIFTSLMGRMDLVTVPYLLEIRKEARIYEPLTEAIGRRMHVAPHVLDLAATWAVLTRLHAPDPDNHPSEVRDALADLEPLEKALLYDGGPAPERFPDAVRRRLRNMVADLYDEFRGSTIYEGRFGASPREMRTVLSEAAYRREGKCLTPPALFEELDDLVEDRTLYDFLRLEPRRGYHDSARFIRVIEQEFARRALDELRDAMDLVEEAEYDRRFERYFEHVVAHIRGEKVRNPQTGRDEPADEKVLRAVEETLDMEALEDSAEDFRRDLVARIGAWSLDNPGEKPPYRELFPKILRAMKHEFFEVRREKVQRLQEDLSLAGDDLDNLDDDARERVEGVLTNLQDRHGYCRRCAMETAVFTSRRALEDAEED